MKPIEIRRKNRRTAYNCFAELDRERGGDLLGMMRTMVQALGVEEAMRRCDFKGRNIPDEAIEIQRLACEYILFEETPKGNAMKELPCPLCYGTGESRMSICDCQMPATPAAEVGELIPSVHGAMLRLGRALLAGGPADDIGPPPEVTEEYYAASDAVKALAVKMAESTIELALSPTPADSGECERLREEHAAMLLELQMIATHHVGTTYPVPEGEPPLWVQNRSVMGRYEDNVTKLRTELAAARATIASVADALSSDDVVEAAEDIYQLNVTLLQLVGELRARAEKAEAARDAAVGVLERLRTWRDEFIESPEYPTYSGSQVLIRCSDAIEAALATAKGAGRE